MKRIWIAGLLACLLVPLFAQAERNLTLLPSTTESSKRVALVIGNGAYEKASALLNPANDADDMTEALKEFGFEVIALKNAKRRDMREAIEEFGQKISDADAALIYYAGHGVQVRGENYLLPVDADIGSESAVRDEGVSVNYLLDQMEGGRGRVNIVMLDACRDNPITGKYRSGGTRGLAIPGSAPRGTVIVYATDPGNVAADGNGRNGLFTAGMLTAFKGKNLSLDSVLTLASEQVELASNGKQMPYVNGPKPVQKAFHFRVTVDPGPAQTEQEFWGSIKESNDQADFAAYLKQYPDGSFKLLAENRLKRLEQAELAEQAKLTAIKVAAAQANAAAQVIVPVAVASPRPEFRDAFLDGSGHGPKMVIIPAGSFTMGVNDSKNEDEKPAHKVTFNKDFALGKYEVTQEEWLTVMGSAPPALRFTKCGKTCPAEGVSWFDTQDFIQKLNTRTGQIYRLPSEAEWNYACLAGMETVYCGSDDVNAVAWYASTSGKKTHPVGGLQANTWGLYDMSGNAWEWVEDWYHVSYETGLFIKETAPVDGSAWVMGGAKTYHVIRGGGWSLSEQAARANNRGWSPPSGHNTSWSFGFRLAKSLP